ncbi:hypothetical protein VTN77DRAFT_3129 [Rasamsonia byssochlamydoides]|uniref:uncharacterized protein n=1 Tax=Rasamsonia byssochlamydoides TaxID=89139 RepID=UPI00374396CC
MTGHSSTMAAPGQGLDASDGSALQFILEHYLSYPGSYEIPLRTMYTLNCASRSLLGQPSTPAFQESAFARGNAQGSSTVPPSDPAAQFRAQLIAQIARLPSQPCSLPVPFITNFLRRCFTPELDEVDFPQALTALDYLKDLETRRRKDVASALKRLDVQRDDLAQMEELRKKYPGVVRWVESIDEKERRVEALYTHVYIGLRRWTLLNEMLLEPFNKANCLAMLNTLFPPVTAATTPPTAYLTPTILQSQRDGFWRYITGVERNGKEILNTVMQQGAREGEETAWPAVRETLDKYLRVANEIIDECSEVNGRDTLEDESHGWSHKRKADSGISFGSSDRPLSPSNHSSNGDSMEKPLPPWPDVKPSKSSGSTLERIAREIRKMRSRSDVKENSKGKTKAKGLSKKMKSSGALGVGRGNSSSSSSEDSLFDVEEFKRKRLIWEANQRKKEQQEKQASHKSH